MSGVAPAPEGITNPPIDELLERTSSKYGLVIFAAKRARQVRAREADAQLVFLAPPSWAELESRLAGRGSEPPAVQEQRLRIAQAELDAAGEFDVVVVNDDVARAADELVGWLTAPSPRSLRSSGAPE